MSAPLACSQLACPHSSNLTQPPRAFSLATAAIGLSLLRLWHIYFHLFSNPLLCIIFFPQIIKLSKFYVTSPIFYEVKESGVKERRNREWLIPVFLSQASRWIVVLDEMGNTQWGKDLGIYMHVHTLFSYKDDILYICFITQVFNLAMLMGHLACHCLLLLHSFSYMHSFPCTSLSLFSRKISMTLILLMLLESIIWVTIYFIQRLV